MALSVLLSKSAKQWKPEEPKVFIRTNLTQSVVSLIDFVPGMVVPPKSGFLSTDVMKDVEFTDFRALVEEANKWLKCNLEWEVITCESIVFMKKSADSFDVKNTDTCYFDFAMNNKYLLKCLRIWIQRRKERYNPDKCQQISFVDFIPENVNSNKSKPTFETKEVIMAKINEQIKNNEIPGKVINIDMVDCSTNADWTVDTIATLAEQNTAKCLYVFRVFFDCSEENDGLIEVEDFVPKTIATGSFFKRAKYETVPEVFKRIEEWIAKCPVKRVINIKSVQLSTDSKGAADISSLTFTIPGDLMLFSRLFYIKADNSNDADNRNVVISQFTPNSNKEAFANLVKRINDRCLIDYRDRSHRGLMCCESQLMYCRKSTVEELQKQSNKSLHVLRYGSPTGYIYFVQRIYCDFGAVND